MTKVISSGLVMRLTGLILRSSLSEQGQTTLIDQLGVMTPSEASRLTKYLEMNQLDLTQLSNYTNDDITKRLDYIEANEKM